MLSCIVLYLIQISAEIRLLFWNHVTFGPLVFEIQYLTFGPLVAALSHWFSGGERCGWKSINVGPDELAKLQYQWLYVNGIYYIQYLWVCCNRPLSLGVWVTGKTSPSMFVLLQCQIQAWIKEERDAYLLCYDTVWATIQTLSWNMPNFSLSCRNMFLNYNMKLEISNICKDKF